MGFHNILACIPLTVMHTHQILDLETSMLHSDLELFRVSNEDRESRDNYTISGCSFCKLKSDEYGKQFLR